MVLKVAQVCQRVRLIHLFESCGDGPWATGVPALGALGRCLLSWREIQVLVESCHLLSWLLCDPATFLPTVF